MQVGTLFAYCDESGIAPALRRAVLAEVAAGTARVRTDPRASPTGFPFKLVQGARLPVQGDDRARVCDLGYLRAAYRRPDGRLGYRCPAEPVADYVAKGGRAEETVGRRCLCNGLAADVGIAQWRPTAVGPVAEPPLLTAGDDLLAMGGFLAGRSSYSAADVVRWLLTGAAEGGVVQDAAPPGHAIATSPALAAMG